MSTPFQNRLVGTVIVAAVMIIFLPDILDGNKNEYHAEFEAIPTAPQAVQVSTRQSFPNEKFNELSKEDVIDAVAVDEDESYTALKEFPHEESALDDATKVSPLSKEKSIINSGNSPAKPTNALPEKALPQTAWVVQLGSFRHEKNVKELILKLKKAGYIAFSRPIKTKNGTLTKVCVGPELIKSKLEEKLPDLKKLTGVQGKIARFKPQS